MQVASGHVDLAPAGRPMARVGHLDGPTQDARATASTSGDSSRCSRPDRDHTAHTFGDPAARNLPPPELPGVARSSVLAATAGLISPDRRGSA
jgi:hypothetical protein